MEKITLLPFIPAGLGIIISSLPWIFPQYINLSSQQSGNMATILPAILGFTAAVIFLIQRLITNRENIQKKRQNHFEILKKNALQPWSEEVASLFFDRNGCNHSFLELYTNIFDKLKSNLRFQKVKSHLEDQHYKQTKELLDKIESRSKEHNRNVSNFIGSIESKIITYVFKKDASVGIISNFIEFKNPNQGHGYSMTNIFNHYSKEAMGNHANLTIDQEQELTTTKFQIHRDDVGSNVAPLVISINRQELDSIKKKLEGETMKAEIVDKLNGFLKDGKDIVDLYNDRFIAEIQNIITEIEDEGEMKGRCSLKYCNKKSRQVWQKTNE